MKIAKINIIIILIYLIFIQIFAIECYGAKENIVEELDKIKDAIKEYILSYYYWKGIFLNEEDKKEFFPYDVRIKIEIKREVENENGKNIYYCVVGNGIDRKEKMIYKIVKERNEVVIIKDYFKEMVEKWTEIEQSKKGDIWEGTIILPSDWEPKYPAVEGKKKEMVEKIKRLVKRYFFRFVIKKEDDFKEIMNEKITIYIRDFYLWEEGSEIIIVSDKSSFLGNLSFYDAIEGKFIEGEYDEWTCLTPTKWKFPKNFKLENYKGGDEFLRKFAKHYIKEEIQITKEDIEQWQRKHQKK